jgi:hypothetical protein
MELFGLLAFVAVILGLKFKRKEAEWRLLNRKP